MKYSKSVCTSLWVRSTLNYHLSPWLNSCCCCAGTVSLGLLDGGTANNDNPSELQLEANRPPIIFLYISFRLRPFSQIICVEFFFLCFCKLDKLGKYFVLLTPTLVCLINGETQKTGRWGVNFYYLFHSGQGAVFFLYLLHEKQHCN